MSRTLKNYVFEILDQSINCSNLHASLTKYLLQSSHLRVLRFGVARAHVTERSVLSRVWVRVRERERAGPLLSAAVNVLKGKIPTSLQGRMAIKHRGHFTSSNCCEVLQLHTTSTSHCWTSCTVSTFPLTLSSASLSIQQLLYAQPARNQDRFFVVGITVE